MDPDNKNPHAPPTPPTRRRFLRSALATAALVGAPAGTALAAAVKRDVPFYSARSDLESTLACARMILSNFDREEHYPVVDVIDMIYHRPGYWTFEAQLIPILTELELGATLHATTPYRDLIQGRGFEQYGPGAKSKVDRKALAWAAGYFNDATYRHESVPFDQVLAWFKKGALMMIGVDRSTLRRTTDSTYCRYNVIITGVEPGRVRYHDPVRGPHRWAPEELIKKAYEATSADRAVIGALRTTPRPVVPK